MEKSFKKLCLVGAGLGVVASGFGVAGVSLVSIGSAGLGLVGIAVDAVAIGEIIDFQRPSDVACIKHPSKPDFGPLERCGDNPQPHGRVVQVNAPTVTSTSTGSTATLNTAVVVFDADFVDIVQHVGQLPECGRTFPKPTRLFIAST